MSTSPVPFIIGAYAAVPAERAAQEDFYQALSDTGFVTGIEIPWRGGALDPDPAWLAGQLAGRFPNGVVTAIPDTMKTLGSDPTFGLASPDNTGRQAALAAARTVFALIAELNELAGERVVDKVEFQSAPSGSCDAHAFASSLTELKAEAAGDGLEIVVEHCDAREGAGAGEKNFLSLDEEIDACAAAGVQITLNWGRSVIESHDPDTPRAQAAKLADRGLLAGLMCSGASPEETQYGPIWGDAHLPLATDEPSSWLTPERASEFIEAGAGTETYRGIKIQVPADADVATRIAMITRVKNAMS